MVMFFLLLGFIGLWAVTEIIESFMNEDSGGRSSGRKNTLRWIDQDTAAQGTLTIEALSKKALYPILFV